MMSLRMLLLSVLLVAVLPASPARAAAQGVGIRNFAFEPATLHAATGDTVTWTWTEGTHTVTAHSGDTFDTGRRSAPDSFSVTFAGGTVAYRCKLHSSIDEATSVCSGMCALITDDVTAPPSPTISRPSDGDEYRTTDVAIAGSADPDAALVRLAEGSTTFAEVGVAEGTWSAAASFPFGSHSVEATALDAAGNHSAPSSPVTFRVTVDTAGPAVVVSSPRNREVVVGGPVTVTGSAFDNVAVAGVWVTTRDSLHRLVSDARADCTGCGTPNVAWTLQLSVGAGAYSIEPSATDMSGNLTIAPAITIVVA